MNKYLCLARDKTKANKLKSQLVNIGLPDVDAESIGELYDLNGFDIIFITYEYSELSVINEVVNKSVDNDNVVVLCSDNQQDLFIEELCSKHVFHVNILPKMFNNDILKSTVRRCDEMKRSLSEVKDGFFQSVNENSGSDEFSFFISKNKSATSYVFSKLAHKNVSIYRKLLTSLNFSQLPPFYQIESVRLSPLGNQSIDVVMSYTKDRKLGYYANLAIASRQFSEKKFNVALPYAFKALSFNPMSNEIFTIICSSALMISDITHINRALKVRKVHSSFTVEDFNYLLSNVLSFFSVRKLSQKFTTKQRKNNSMFIDELSLLVDRKNRGFFVESLTLLSLFILIKSGKRLPALIFYNRYAWIYDNELTTVLHKSIHVELGNLKKSKDFFFKFSMFDLDDKHLFRRIYKINKQKYKLALDEYISMRSETSHEALIQSYGRFPFSYEYSMLMSRAILTSENGAFSRKLRLKIARNIRTISDFS